MVPTLMELIIWNKIAFSVIKRDLSDRSSKQWDAVFTGKIKEKIFNNPKQELSSTFSFIL